jgi:hypothetical protein
MDLHGLLGECFTFLLFYINITSSQTTDAIINRTELSTGFAALFLGRGETLNVGKRIPINYEQRMNGKAFTVITVRSV